VNALDLAAWESRAAALSTDLVASGAVSDPAWAEAFASVPRHVFVPSVLSDGGTVVDAGASSWLDTVYADETLRTQTRPVSVGATRQEIPSSSSTRPQVMAVMLDRLDAHPGHRVLEIGTGTGYNTALLSHHLGAEHIYSLDIDPALVADAQAHLAHAGYRPHLAAGDGAAGWPDGQVFDRIIATCAVTAIPPAWINQLSPGGRIVAPLDAGSAGPLLVLDKTSDDEVTGIIDPYPALFMPMRDSVDNPLGPGQTLAFTGAGMPHYGTTTLNPAVLFAEDIDDLKLFLWLHAPGLHIAGSAQSGTVVVHTADTMAKAALAPLTEGSWPVEQYGPHRLWDVVEHAHRSWVALGHPGAARFGVTAANDAIAQYVWLDEPNGTHTWPLTIPPS
jgi:protein-L-isoaspartate(D-aspartate) O-methyltransferase